jgi:hypothetical protein
VQQTAIVHLINVSNYIILSVFPGNFSEVGKGVKIFQLKTEDRETGDLGVVAPKAGVLSKRRNFGGV